MKFKEWVKIHEYDDDGYERLRTSKGLRMPPENIASFLRDRGGAGSASDITADVLDKVTPHIGGFMDYMLSKDTKMPLAPSYRTYSSKMSDNNREFSIITDKEAETHPTKEQMQKKKASLIQMALQNKEVKALVTNRKINPQFAHVIGPKPLESDPSKEVWRVNFDVYDPNDRSLGYYNMKEPENKTPQETEHGK